MTTCARPTCNRAANPKKNRGLCNPHYDKAPLRGYVDSMPARNRVARLRALGMTLDMLTEQGLSKWGIQGINTNDRILAMTEERVFSIPLPEPILSGAPVDGLGTRRRLQALMALGYPTAMIGAELGMMQNAVSAMAKRATVTAAKRAAVAELFERWCMTPGPNAETAKRAARSGYMPPLAWEDIDDPDEVPSRGEVRHVPFAERLADAEFMNIRKSEIPQWCGIQEESLVRNLQRQALREAS